MKMSTRRPQEIRSVESSKVAVEMSCFIFGYFWVRNAARRLVNLRFYVVLLRSRQMLGEHFKIYHGCLFPKYFQFLILSAILPFDTTNSTERKHKWLEPVNEFIGKPRFRRNDTIVTCGSFLGNEWANTLPRRDGFLETNWLRNTVSMDTEIENYKHVDN
jgi:hypothetical protein